MPWSRMADVAMAVDGPEILVAAGQNEDSTPGLRGAEPCKPHEIPPAVSGVEELA